MSEQRRSFYWIEITYRYGSETKHFSFMNCSAKKVQEIRATVLEQGLQIPIELAMWIVVFPSQIVGFTYCRQEKFFTNYHSDLKRTVFDLEGKLIS